MVRSLTDVPVFSLGAHQSVAYTGTAGTIANATANHAQWVRVLCTTDAYLAIAASPTATTADMYVTALTPEYFRVNGAVKVSAVQVAAAGTLHVTEMGL